jgi:aspartate-semialdehyde dehydrogenase
VVSLEHALEQKPDIALFSAGGAVSKQWAPRFAEKGCLVIDNSSAWRMDPQVPLIVPEVNGHILKTHDRIIANPNCSTIQLIMVLKPLSDRYGLERVLVSTYQSVTGTGQKAVRQLEEEREGNGSGERVYPHAIDLNIIPHCDVFVELNYTREEMKLLLESRKILGLPELRLSATAVRIPVRGGHSESVYAELKEQPTIPEVRELLAAFPGLIVQDEPEKNIYPMPAIAEGRDEVFVGRIREDLSHPRALNLFVVADNLRKGAATNAVQIAEMVRSMHFS